MVDGMPNTLGHLGIQGLLSRSIIRDADLKWIGLGCVIPDLPWILQRVSRVFLPDSQLLDLRLYASVQSSLVACLVLSGALALFSAAPRRVFQILSLNSFLHLILDSVQTKWGNGVHFFAPFSWQLVNFNMFWPESTVSVLLTVWGLLWIAHVSWRRPGKPVPLFFGRSRRVMAGTGLLLTYLIAPIGLLAGPERADNYSARVLRERDHRPGRGVEFDRALYLHGKDTDVVSIFTGEELVVEERRLHRSGIVSLRGRFLDESGVEILEAHLHWRWFRDLASYLGLILVALVWVGDLFRTGSPGRGRS